MQVSLRIGIEVSRPRDIGGYYPSPWPVGRGLVPMFWLVVVVLAALLWYLG